MMTMQEQVLAEVEAFMERMDMRPTTFGMLAMGDKGFVFRLREGRPVKTTTIDALRLFMSAYRPPVKKRGNGRASAAAA